MSYASSQNPERLERKNIVGGESPTKGPGFVGAGFSPTCNSSLNLLTIPTPPSP